MVSPGSLFKTPPGVRMSVGKKRALWGAQPSLNALHSTLTRLSATLTETRNLHNKLTKADARKRAIYKRHHELKNWDHSLRFAMRLDPQNHTRRGIIETQKEINAILINERNAERKSAKLTKEWERSLKRYRQLARRVAHLNGTRTLNTRPLTENEKQTIRLTGQMIRNMAAARRTTRRFPFGQNVGDLIVRSIARR